MARKKKRPPKGANDRRRVWHPSSWSGAFLNVERLRIIAHRLILFSLFAFLIWASLEVQTRVQNDPHYRVENWTLHFGEFPEWVSPEIRSEIEASCQEGLLVSAVEVAPDGSEVSTNPTVFRRGLFDRVRAALLSHPWVRSVSSISLRYPGIGEDESAGGLAVDLELRRPIAMVQYDGRYYLTDHEARRLGAAIDRPNEQYRLPIVVGAERFRQGPAPASGDVWQTREVLEGLAVAWQLFQADIQDRYPDVPVETISIGNVGGRLHARDPEILLGLRDLPPVAWGRSPVSRGARVVTVPDKLRKLDVVLRDPRSHQDFAMIRLDTKRMVGVSFH